jgi:hypothetical protein
LREQPQHRAHFFLFDSEATFAGSGQAMPAAGLFTAQQGGRG